MALKKSFEIDKGLIANDGYVRIEFVTIARRKQACITVSIYASADNGQNPVQSRCYAFDYILNADNVIANAYNHLKTLPEFKNAIDC